MKPIPVSAAKRVASEFDYDQVIIIARKVGKLGGEHVTTYGANKEHCKVAADCGRLRRHCSNRSRLRHSSRRSGAWAGSSRPVPESASRQETSASTVLRFCGSGSGTSGSVLLSPVQVRA